MDLILWRHAEAGDTHPDLERQLTTNGRDQAARIADWLNPRLPPDIRVLASPALRTRQTAQTLGREFESIEELGLNASAEGVLAAVGWPSATRPVLVVGHQPTLGRIAQLLLSGRSGDLEIRKGSVWWFRHRELTGAAQAVLHAMTAPDWL